MDADGLPFGWQRHAGVDLAEDVDAIVVVATDGATIAVDRDRRVFGDHRGRAVDQHANVGVLTRTARTLQADRPGTAGEAAPQADAMV